MGTFKPEAIDLKAKKTNIKKYTMNWEKNEGKFFTTETKL